MKVKINDLESELRYLVGGSPQGTLIGQLLYCGSCDDAASEIPDENKFKYIDDLDIFELVCISGALLYYVFFNILPQMRELIKHFWLPPHLKCKTH